MRGLKKAMKWKPDARLVAGMAFAAFVLLMIPLLRIAIYSVPYYDDYKFGGFVKGFLAQERSLRSALQGALYCTKTNWYAWQGTYSASFFNSLMPMVWGEQYYFLGVVFLILVLPVSIMVLVKVLLHDVLKADWPSCVAMQAAMAAMAVVLLYSPQQGFYWYVGGMSYVGMHSFLMLTIAAWIKLLVGSGRVKAILLMLWSLVGAALAGGATYVTALQGLLICLGLVGLGAILRSRRTWLLVPSLLVYGYGFFKNVTAPGNQVRARWYVGWGYPPIEAVFRSFLEAFSHLGEFSGWITLACLILFGPIIWRMVCMLKFSFRLPGLVLAASFCLYATGFTPTLYAMGHGGYGRVLNCVKITYQILLIINEVYWLGWLRGVLDRKGKTVSGRGAVWWFYPLMGAVMLFIFAFLSRSQAGCYSSYGAYYFVHTGEAYNFYQEYKNRIDTIVNGGPDVVVKPYVYKPWFLFIKDLGEDPMMDENQSMAAWYGKNSISCISETQE
ncbi:MAG: hypothetical protein OSJ69_05335 [Acetatifactor sp.]|nr:hypothetical protein [Acetatifactor sp.]